MSAALPEEYQRFIAYALIGYLDVVRRTGTGDYNYNFTIGPRRLGDELKRAGAHAEILDLFDGIDELESLLTQVDPGHDLTEYLAPVIKLLRSEATFPEEPRRAIEALVAQSQRLAQP